MDTVGARLTVLRRLAHPDDARLGPPLQVVVTAARSLLQPMTPQLGLIEPVTLSVGAEVEFEDVIARLVELAYTRVDMVGRRGEFAVRGGILDVFRRRPSTRCASSSGVTRSVRCGCSPSPISVRSRRSRSTP